MTLLTQKPLIIAHRGASLEAPENTMRAFELALQYQADGIELDILQSKDEELVVIHDEKLQRLAGQKGRVGHYDLKELKSFDFGIHFSEKFKGEKIPLLEEVLELVRGKVLLNIEIKGKKIRDDGKESRLVSLLRQYDMINQVVISSFNLFSLKRIQRMVPEIRCGCLFYEHQVGARFWPKWTEWIKPYSVHLSQALVGPTTVNQIHRQNYQCWVWTVNKPEKMLSLQIQGVDAIITDDPKAMLQVLNRPTQELEK